MKNLSKIKRKRQILKKHYNSDSQIIGYEKIANFHKDSKSLTVAAYSVVEDKMELLDMTVKLINDLE